MPTPPSRSSDAQSSDTWLQQFADSLGDARRTLVPVPASRQSTRRGEVSIPVLFVISLATAALASTVTGLLMRAYGDATIREAIAAKDEATRELAVSRAEASVLASRLAGVEAELDAAIEQLNDVYAIDAQILNDLEGIAPPDDPTALVAHLHAVLTKWDGEVLTRDLADDVAELVRSLKVSPSPGAMPRIGTD